MKITDQEIQEVAEALQARQENHGSWPNGLPKVFKTIKERNGLDDMYVFAIEGAVKTRVIQKFVEKSTPVGKTVYCVKHHGEKVRWLQLTGIDDDHPDGTGWTLVNSFNRSCLLDKDQAEGFVNDPKTEDRYRIHKMKLVKA